MKAIFLFWAVFAVVSFGQASPWNPLADERVIMIGGGDYPEGAMKQFSDWAGGKKAKIVAIHWASENPEESFQYFKSQMSQYSPQSLELLPLPESNPPPVNQIMSMLSSATGIFFGGGDQTLVMERANRYPQVANLIRRLYHEGVVFMGTSAGTAVVAQTMLTGEGDFTVIDPEAVKTAEGFGFLQHIVVDQHFLARQRMNRLISILTGSSERFGLGIDEATAVALVNGTTGTVYGKSKVIKFERESKGQTFTLSIYSAGDTLHF